MMFNLPDYAINVRHLPNPSFARGLARSRFERTA